MPRIRINTPRGIATVDIAGDTPSAEELGRLRKLVPPTAGNTFDYSVVGKDEEQTAKTRTAVAPTSTADVDGEVENIELRYLTGRMDTDEEKSNLLGQLIGTNTFERVGPDSFVIDQSKLTPEVRSKYGLGDKGKVFLNKPGFSWYDLADFAGQEGPVVGAAIATSLAVSSWATVPAMLTVGAVAAGAKAIDEGIEWFQGLNKQSAGDVAARIAIEAPLNALFEGGGRFVSRLIGRALKGPGPAVNIEARVKEIVTSTGASRKEATRQATEEARLAFKGAVAEGARPTVFAATGKALAGRILGMNEKIMPNPKVARDNVQFMEKIISDLKGGNITKEEATRILQGEFDGIAALFNKKLADPNQLYKTIQDNLDNIVKTELKAFEDAFVPAKGIPDDYVESVNLAANLFKAETSKMYDVAKELIGKEKFSIEPIKQTIKNLKDQNRFLNYEGKLFDDIAEAENLSLTDLQSLKQAFRLASGNPDLVQDASQAGISRIIQSIDDVLTTEWNTISKQVADGFKVYNHPKTGRFVSVPIGPAEKQSLREGLAAWDKANKIYTEGQDAINNTAINVIIKNARDKFFNSNKDVVDQIVKSRNPEKLKMYLKAATPNPMGAAKISRPGAAESIDQLRSLFVDPDGAIKVSPLFDDAENLILNSGLKDILPSLNPWVAKLPINDPFRVMHLEQYVKELDSLSTLARAGANPEAIRNSVRNNLAKTWMSDSIAKSNDPLGRFSSARFASQFDDLGKETQDLLFGNAAASRMRNVTEEFYLLGANQDDVLRALRQGADSAPTGSLQGQIQALKEAIESSKTASDDAFATSLRTGEVSNPQTLVSALIGKNGVQNFAKLRSVVGDEQLDRVGGVKDMVVQNLIRNSMEGLDEVSMQAGTWGKKLGKNIEKQNEYGQLDEILGKDVVSQLTKIAKMGEDVSDIPIKGFGGLVAATTALSIGAAFATLSVPGMIAAGAALVPVMAMSRLLRNKTVLGLMTSPRMRAKTYEQAIKAGADLPNLAELKAQGPWVYAMNRIASIANSELALVAGSGIDRSAFLPQDQAEAPAQAPRTFAPRAPRPQRGLPPLPRLPTMEELGARTGGSSGIIGINESPLRRIEMNKLMTGRP